MMQNRRQMLDGQQLPDTDMAYHKRESRPLPYLFAFLAFVALALGSCQSPLPPLPNPPGPHTAVRLSPGDVLKLSFAEESDLDQVQRIRRDGKISLPFLGEVTAAGKRVIDPKESLSVATMSTLKTPRCWSHWRAVRQPSS